MSFRRLMLAVPALWLVVMLGAPLAIVKADQVPAFAVRW